MRYYKLQIGTFGGLTFELNGNNPNAPAIQFRIQQFEQIRTTNSELVVYNLPTYLYGQFPKLLGQKIQLFAGFEKSPITTANGITPSKSLVVQGYISQIIPDYNSIDKGILFIIQSVPFYQTVAGVTRARTSLQSFYNLNIKIGDDPVTQIKLAFIKLCGLGVILDTKSVISEPAQVATCQTIYNIYDLASLAKYTYKLVIYEATDKFIMINEETPSVPTNIKMLKSVDFLGQPSSIGLQSIELNLELRGDLTLNSFIMLPSDLFVGLTALSEVRNVIDFDLFLNKSIYLFFSGILRIVKVWHTGDSRNTDVMSWATHIEAVTVEGLK